MADVMLTKIESEQREIQSELRTCMKDVGVQLQQIQIEIATLKSRMTVLSAGAAAIFGAMVWALQYLLTH
jgi:hypothetical protein